MKILMTADTVGGVWTYALELTRALAPWDVEVALATMGDPLRPEQAAAAAELDTLTVYESAFKLEWMDVPWEDVKYAGAWLKDLADWIRPDVVHFNNFGNVGLDWRAPTLVVAHSCVLSWWQAVKGVAAPAEWLKYRSTVFAGIQAADVVVAPTGAMLSSVELHYGNLRDGRVIYNGRAADLFSPTLKEPLIFAAGRLWDEAKNVCALQDVAPRLPWPVCVAGEAQHPDGGKAPICNVRCLGCLAAEDVGAYLGRASIYALPARYEPFGLSVLEAAMAGCALVLGDIPSLREVWGEAAVYVPPGDHHALEGTLRGLIDHPERREALAQRARTRALRYTPERMADEYRRLYGELTARHVRLQRRVG